MVRSVYMQISKDEYEFPLAIADSIQELAEIIGKSPATIGSYISRCKKSGRKCRYIKINIEEEEE